MPLDRSNALIRIVSRSVAASLILARIGIDGLFGTNLVTRSSDLDNSDELIVNFIFRFNYCCVIVPT